jgi:hypothetical protein
MQEAEAELGCVRRELQAGQEEAAGWQRHCRQLQEEADERQLELARRDLRTKVRLAGFAAGGAGSPFVRFALCAGAQGRMGGRATVSGVLTNVAMRLAWWPGRSWRMRCTS